MVFMWFEVNLFAHLMVFSGMKVDRKKTRKREKLVSHQTANLLFVHKILIQISRIFSRSVWLAFLSFVYLFEFLISPLCVSMNVMVEIVLSIAVCSTIQSDSYRYSLYIPKV